MASTFRATQTIGEIVAAFPDASALFKAYGIDFCCGGHRTLGEALREQGIDEATFLAELEQAWARQRPDAAPTDWRRAPYGTLVAHIVGEHHDYLKRELPLLAEFIDKIGHVHGQRHPELSDLNRKFQALRAELEGHMLSEERDLFPLVQSYEQSGSQADLAKALTLLEELEAEHQAAGDLLKEMRRLTRDYRVPEDACSTYALTFQKLVYLESDMFEHIHLENNILFPRLRSEISRV